ncbi:MAG TPA: hypoxanthine phosphoribosyltransferase [Stellaceae bacterium]|nr:hypoxanthine phosphoribosyltransferase [Stellaceae bacterium]
MSEALRPLISARRIKKRVAELAGQISADHSGAALTLLIVLKGATVFAADLMRQITAPFVIDFVRASSYGPAARSSGNVVIEDEAKLDIAGHHVILVEDIVDTGLTITALIAALCRQGPASLDVCALLHKHVAGAQPVDIRYKGFDIPDAFVVGYGMDYAERYRNLPGVYRLRKEAGNTKK